MENIPLPKVQQLVSQHPITFGMRVEGICVEIKLGGLALKEN